MEGEQRSPRQNNALHQCCADIRDELNGAGKNVQETLSKPLEIPWTAELVKELMVRPVMHAMFGIDSTTQLTRKQVSELFKVILDHLSDKHGIAIDFPSDEPPMMADLDEYNDIHQGSI